MNSTTAAVLVDVLEAANRHEEKPLEVRVGALEVAHRIALADLEAERQFMARVDPADPKLMCPPSEAAFLHAVVAEDWDAVESLLSDVARIVDKGRRRGLIVTAVNRMIYCGLLDQRVQRFLDAYSAGVQQAADDRVAHRGGCQGHA